MMPGSRQPGQGPAGQSRTRALIDYTVTVTPGRDNGTGDLMAHLNVGQISGSCFENINLCPVLPSPGSGCDIMS